MAQDTVRWCYRCGQEQSGTECCPACGCRTDLPEDVFFLNETCCECDRALPRWSLVCPWCGTRQKKNDDAAYPKQWRAYKLRLILADLVWTAALALAACILPGKLAALNTTTAFVLAGAAAIVIWSSAVLGMFRGRFWDGTVEALSTEPGTEKVCVDAGTFQEVPCTVYHTYIRWDNGKTLDRTTKGNCADHVQLKKGDRVRLYYGIERIAKLN